MIIGVVEEVGKLAIVAIIIWNSKTVKYAINGLLIGAAIGAGFAAFESSGYAFRIFINNLLGSGNVAFAYGEMTENIFLRAFLAPGGHIVWAAIAGYAVMLIKGDKQLDMSFLNKKAFWKIFWIPIVLHGVWDMPISLGGDSLIVAIIPQILLSLIAWVVVLILISNSLAQIGNILKREAAEKSGVDVI